MVVLRALRGCIRLQIWGTFIDYVMSSREPAQKKRIEIRTTSMLGNALDLFTGGIPSFFARWLLFCAKSVKRVSFYYYLRCGRKSIGS